LDRVDLKQAVPNPSPTAIYDIFRSCLNELLNNDLVDARAEQTRESLPPANQDCDNTQFPEKVMSLSPEEVPSRVPATSSPSPKTPREPLGPAPTTQIPSYSEMQALYSEPASYYGRRVWQIAQQSKGLSGRALRRLPIIGLAMYTWGGHCSLDDAISALDTAVHEELISTKLV
jgi:pachytene checkpoint protein 2